MVIDYLREKKLFLQNISIIKGNNRRNKQDAENDTKPIFLFSSCIDKNNGGDIKYNGGVVLYNLWVKLLRSHGYEAYIVTYDGKYQSWLPEHQPHISIENVKSWKNNGLNLKFITSWIKSETFLNLADEFYFHDCEPHYTFGFDYPILKKMLKTKIRAIGSETRMEQAYYRTLLNVDTKIIPPYCDLDYWFPNSNARISGLIGYTNENTHIISDIEKIENFCREKNYNLKFVRLSGDGQNYITSMQKCDIYIGLNSGKDKWGEEGLARTHMEAMYAGCVVIVYDVGGNREFIIDRWNGYLISIKDPVKIAEIICYLMDNPEIKEQTRKNSINFSTNAFSKERCWKDLKNFFELL